MHPTAQQATAVSLPGFWRKAVPASLLIVFFGVIVNWPRPAETPPRSAASAAKHSEPERASRVAGRPFRFYTGQGPNGAPVFEPVPAAANAFCFALLAALTSAFAQVASSRHLRGRLRFPHTLRFNRRRRIALGLGAAAAASLLAVLYWGHQQKLQQQVAQWRLYGEVTQGPRFDGAVLRYLPAPRLRWTEQPVVVNLTDAPSHIVQQIAATRSIREITLQKTTFAPGDLRCLAELPSLKTLRLVSCDLTEAECREIAAFPALTDLALVRCNGSEAIAAHLPDARRLQSLRIDRLPWSACEDFHRGFGRHIQRLELGFESVGGTASLAVAAAPELTELNIRVERSRPGAILDLHLAQLPRLHDLSLPRNLMIDLTAEDLNVLQWFDNGPSHSAGGPGPPAFPQFRKLTLRDIPRLHSLRCDIDALEHLELRNVPDLRTVRLTAGTRAFRSDSASFAQHRAAVIRMLGDCDGPATLDLSSLSLHQADLTPLAGNRRLRRLVLTDTDVTAAQLCSIGELTQLKSLDLRRCGILDGDIEGLLTALPGLRALDIESARVTRLNLHDHPNLEMLAGTSWNNLRSLSIVGCPNLRGGFELTAPLVKLHVRDARALERLTVRRSLPADTVLEGFQSLHSLSLRGERVTDALLAGFADCFGLTELKLTATALTERGVAELGRYRDLMSLEIPGAPLNDAVAADWWRRMPDLRLVDVSRTQIAGESLQWLAVLPNLQQLDVSHTQLREDDSKHLAQMNRLVDLDAAGIPFTPDALTDLVNLKRLERLNVSDRVIDDRLKRALVECAPMLLYLGVERCGLSDQDIRVLLGASPQMALGAKGNFASADTRREMLRSGRWIDARERTAFQARLNRLAGASGREAEAGRGDFRLVRTPGRQRNRPMTAPQPSRPL